MAIVNLKINGNGFNEEKFDKTFDILEGTIIECFADEIYAGNIRYDCKTDEASYELLSDEALTSDSFKNNLKDLISDDYYLTSYLIEKYQEYKYSFYKDGNIDKEEIVEYFRKKNIDNIKLIINVHSDETMKISLSEDIGLIIDKYKNNKLEASETLYFEDYYEYPPLTIKVWETKKSRDIDKGTEVESFYTLLNASNALDTLYFKIDYAYMEVQDELNENETLICRFKNEANKQINLVEEK